MPSICATAKIHRSLLFFSRLNVPDGFAMKQHGRFVYKPQRLLRCSPPQHCPMLIVESADRRRLETAESRHNFAVS
jgi:hypothetical protein